MSREHEFVDAMIESLDPEGVEYFATAQGDLLEALKVGFVAYVREKGGMDSPQHGDVFDVFIEKVRKIYLSRSLH